MAQLRNTKQKQALADALAGAEGFLSARELHGRILSAGGSVGQATVYAQLRSMAEDGLVDTLRTDSGVTLYRRCGLEVHHHHLVCRACGLSVELDVPELEQLGQQLAEREGFTELHHVVELSGVCGTCRP